MGSENCGGGGVGFKDARSDVVSLDFSSNIDSSSSFSRPTEAAAWNKMANGEVREAMVEKSGKELKRAGTSNSVLFLELDAKKQRRTSGKVARKSRLSHLEVCMNNTETVDTEEKAKETGLIQTKGIDLERTLMPRQKTNLNGKRSDRRNGKAPKSKSDSFCVKSGLASFSSAAVGNNILGGYGLRADMEDVTKQVDELSLNELLKGSYKSPNLASNNEQRSADSNEKIMKSVKDAWSVLQTRKSKPPTLEDDVNCLQDVLSPCYLTLDSFVASRNEEANVDTNIVDVSSAHKVQDSGIKFEASANILDFPLCEPKIILERLILPPPKDLEFLLLDSTKPAASKNSADLRSNKPANQRGCLPPFSWSNSYSGHCKSNTDVVKLSTSRSTCQSRWVKVETTLTSPDTTSGLLTELESLKYDNSIVPAEFRTLVPAENEKNRSESVSVTKLDVSTSIVDPQASLVVHSPRALAAAQLLWDIAGHVSKHSGHGLTKSLKRPSQKSMRTPHGKPNEKPENICATPVSKSRISTPANTHEAVFPSKRPRLFVNDKSADIVHSNIPLRGQLPSWSMPRSSRSSPSKSLRGSVSEIRPYNDVKNPFMLPPAARTMEPARSQPKPRKLMRIGWSTESRKMD